MAHIEELSTTSNFENNDEFHQTVEDLVADIYPFSEDLYEVSYFLEKNWLEISEHDKHDVLHIFRDQNQYIYSVDGRIIEGSWSMVEDTNVMILERPDIQGGEEKILYELAFLNSDFFILKRHGKRIALERQFLVMGREHLVRNKPWQEALDLIETQHETNKVVIGIAVIIAILLALYFVFS